MKRGMTIEYLKCRKDLNFEVDFRVNNVIGMTVTKWNVIFSSIIYFFVYSKKYHKYITNIPQIYHKSTTKCDIVPRKGVVYYKM